MNRRRTVFTSLVLLAVSLCISPLATAAETTLHGEGRYSATRTPFTLANGEQVVLMSNYGIASMASPGDEQAPALVQFRCGAMGLLSKDNKFNFNVYCTMTANEKDAIDFKGAGNSDLVKVKVIGGKGRWQNATGSGTITPRRKNGNASDAFSYQFKIKTP